MRIENWRGYNIRFIEKDGEWWAILKDICDALGLRTDGVSQRLNPTMLKRIKVELSEPSSNGVRSRGENQYRWMLAVNEFGIYEALFASRKLEARQFRLWSATVMQKLRRCIGLQQYEVMKMTNPEVQEEINDILDTLFYNPETGQLMQSVTVQGGCVEQIPFEG